MKSYKSWFLSAVGAILLSMGPGCQRKAVLGLGLDVLYIGKDSVNLSSVWMEKTSLPSMKLLSVNFQVYKEEEIGKYLNARYTGLCSFINKHRLSSNRVMAFYYTYDMPFIIEAAIEVDSIPPVLDQDICARVMEGGEALIAHYKGPYEKSALAYHAIYKWLNDNHRVARELPFEVYLNDPTTIKSNNDLLTDIYMFLQ